MLSARAGLGQRLLGPLDHLRLELRRAVSAITASISRLRVPDLEVRHAGELAHRSSVARDGLEHDPVLVLGAKPLSRAAISMLAASRLTSHSHGPGSVSSKSLMSNTSRRSGEAKTPKFDRCASPQHWTCSPERGVPAKSWAMIFAAPR